MPLTRRGKFNTTRKRWSSDDRISNLVVHIVGAAEVVERQVERLFRLADVPRDLGCCHKQKTSRKTSFSSRTVHPHPSRVKTRQGEAHSTTLWKAALHNDPRARDNLQSCPMLGDKWRKTTVGCLVVLCTTTRTPAWASATQHLHSRGACRSRSPTLSLEPAEPTCELLPVSLPRSRHGRGRSCLRRPVVVHRVLVQRLRHVQLVASAPQVHEPALVAELPAVGRYCQRDAHPLERRGRVPGRHATPVPFRAKSLSVKAYQTLLRRKWDCKRNGNNRAGNPPNHPDEGETCQACDRRAARGCPCALHTLRDLDTTPVPKLCATIGA